MHKKGYDPPGSDPMRSLSARLLILSVAFIVLIAISLFAQQRGAPPAGAQQQGGQGRGFGRANTPTFPGPPAGMQALPLDMFTSKNFYKDKALWSDKRYF